MYVEKIITELKISVHILLINSENHLRTTFNTIIFLYYKFGRLYVHLSTTLFTYFCLN